MTNLEKYAEEIKNYKGYEFCKDFVKVKILNTLGLKCDIGCSRCDMLQMMWLMSEYTEPEEPEEPEVDWSKVEVDTPMLVRDSDNEEWHKRHFARYENETIYVWRGGCTSWTAYDSDDVYAWKYAKLAEQEESDE